MILHKNGNFFLIIKIATRSFLACCDFIMDNFYTLFTDFLYEKLAQLVILSYFCSVV